MFEEIPITITIHSDFTYSVSLSFITIPENESRKIIWTIDATGVTDGTQIAFDNPAITLFGGFEETIRDSAVTVHRDWHNHDSLLFGKSFYYRLHMFGRRPAALINATHPEFFAIDHDPTIHNDPPS